MAGAVVLPSSSVGATSGGSVRRLCSVQRDDAPCCNSLFRAHLHMRPPVLPPTSFFAWEARAHLGSPSLRSLFSARGLLTISKNNTRGVVQASLLGVGAPEALVIAVVALLVFGPRGLAEVARTLGKSLRAFQPTIRELQQISRDFKDTLEQEIGLDELRSMEAKPSQPVYKSEQQSQPSNGQSGPNEQKAYSTEDYLRVTEEQAKALVPEDQLKAAEAAAWGGAPPKVKAQTDEQIQGSAEVTNNAGRPQ